MKYFQKIYKTINVYDFLVRFFLYYFLVSNSVKFSMNFRRRFDAPFIYLFICSSDWHLYCFATSLLYHAHLKVTSGLVLFFIFRFCFS